MATPLTGTRPPASRDPNASGDRRLRLDDILKLMVADGLVPRQDAEKLARARTRQYEHPLELVAAQHWRAAKPPNVALTLEWLVEWLAHKLGVPYRHIDPLKIDLTAVTATPDGAIYIAEGAVDRRPEEWTRDLMEKRASGRLLRTGAALDSAEVLRENLAYPNGMMIEPGGSLLYSESWSHAINRAPRDGARLSAPTVLARNLAGYPARLRPSSDGTFWVPFFGVRTLVRSVRGEEAAPAGH